jgi:hypothetical protein
MSLNFGAVRWNRPTSRPRCGSWQESGIVGTPAGQHQALVLITKTTAQICNSASVTHDILCRNGILIGWHHK